MTMGERSAIGTEAKQEVGYKNKSTGKEIRYKNRSSNREIRYRNRSLMRDQI